MSHEPTMSDEFLNALIDDQLDADEKDYALSAVNRDERLARRACELNSLKQLVRHAYPLDADDAHQPRAKLGGRWAPQSLAACFMLLMIGGSAGWLAHDVTGKTGDGHVIQALQTIQQNDFGAVTPARYVVHVDSADPVRLKLALDDAETLLADRHPGGQKTRVEIVANGPGLNLLRAGVSPYAARIEALAKKYPNLGLMACGQTIRKLRAKGVDVVLLPHTKVTPSALEEIISRKLKEDWAYIKV